MSVAAVLFFLRFLRRLSGRPEPMPNPPRLLIGLGNPGPEYEDTRHNVGFVVADRLAERCRAPLDIYRNNAVQGSGSWRGRRVVIAKPTTFMNRSGQAVSALMRRHRAAPEDILVIVDDLYLDPGDIRIRPQGGSGGHNGIQDVIDRLGTDAFPRLRIGVGGDFGRGGQADHVLSSFREDELPRIEDAIARAVDAALTFVTDGVSTAMTRFNRRGAAD